ncbi:hypothetical protein [Geodermatophilus sp. URMC 65]
MTLPGVYDPRRVDRLEALTDVHIATLAPDEGTGATLTFPAEWSGGLLARLIPSDRRGVALLPEQPNVVTVLPEDPLDQASETWHRRRTGQEYRFPLDAYEQYRDKLLDMGRRGGLWTSVREDPPAIELPGDDLQRLGLVPGQDLYLVGRWSFATIEPSRTQLDSLEPLTKHDIVQVLGTGGARYSEADHPQPLLLPSEQQWVEAATTSVHLTQYAQGAGVFEEEVIRRLGDIHAELRQGALRRAAFFALAALWAVLLNLVASAVWSEYGDLLLRLLHLIAAH